MIVLKTVRHRLSNTSFLVVIVLTISFLCSSLVFAREISLEEVLQKTIIHSYDVQLADLDIEISQLRLTESRSSYFPTLNLRYTNEWFKDLTDGDGSLDSVGGTVISSSGSKWKNVLGATLNYNLYDFGVRKRLYDNARRDVAIARLTRNQEEINLSLQVLDLYIGGLKGQEELQGQQLAKELRQEIFGLSQRLHRAGSLDRIQMREAALAVAESNQRLDELIMERAEILHNLTMLSGEQYDEQQTRFVSPRPVPDINPVDITALPEIQAYELAIHKKQAEYEIASNSYLPRLSFYSSYSLYGSDSGDWSQAFSDLDETNFACGITLDLNVFNGLADQAKAARLQAEVRRLKVERDKKIAEHEKSYLSLQHHARLFTQRREQWQSYRNDLNDQADMADRLAREQLRNRLSLLNQQAALEAKELQTRLLEIDRAATLLKLQILAKGQEASRTAGVSIGMGDSND